MAHVFRNILLNEPSKSSKVDFGTNQWRMGLPIGPQQ